MKKLIYIISSVLLLAFSSGAHAYDKTSATVGAIPLTIIGILPFYIARKQKPRSRAGNGFRWSYSLVGGILTMSYNKYGLTENLFGNALISGLPIMLVMWVIGYATYKEKKSGEEAYLEAENKAQTNRPNDIPSEGYNTEQIVEESNKDRRTPSPIEPEGTHTDLKAEVHRPDGSPSEDYDEEQTVEDSQNDSHMPDPITPEEDHADFYEIVGTEIEDSTYQKGLWIKALVDADGDKKKQKVLYIRYRVAQLVAKTNEKTQA